METLLERFLRYVKIDTQSNESTGTHPSTPGQMELALLLAEELRALGVNRINLSEKGYLIAVIPANTDKELPVVGFIAHLDTSPDVTGKNVQPQVWVDYNGQDIILNSPQNIILKVNEYPELETLRGQTIITSDGTTLLGSDDKSGVAIIMAFTGELMNNPDFKHGKIVIGFTPDEEIGHGADFFDVDSFGADFAYTIDGGALGELEYENFNAAQALVHIAGVNVHPGSAYGKMKNALLIAMEFNSLLPVQQRPDYTRGYEGFYHLNKMDGNVEAVEMAYIIRDHDRKAFAEKKVFFEECAAFINRKYGEATIQLKIEDQYYNMKEVIEPVYQIVSLAEQAMLDNKITPHIKPIRGGTDGARLSFMGLPCPNIFTGGHNFHSRFEFASLESMEASVKVMKSMIQLIKERI